MRVLVFNHFFDQDIAAIVAAREENEVHVVPFQYFRKNAVKILGKEITEGELERFNDPSCAGRRHAWKRESKKIFHRLRSVYQFELFVVPSDSFFYIRDFITICRQNGIPVVVLQKETTISPYTMETHSRRIGREFPFISDKMLVCSSRQKQFWLNAGTDETLIDVSGQPRFDIYSSNPLSRKWEELGLPISENERVILFFSYDLDAYAPNPSSTSENATWKKLRDETESALKALAEEGYVVLIKPHPQQRSRRDRQDLFKRMKPLWEKKVFWVDRATDARRLILYADHVVGFQTTALYEAMLARKPVIYTHWSEAVSRYEDKLIPFWKYPEALAIARSPEELIETVLSGNDEVTDAMMEARKHVAVEHIGVIDGCATKRAWEALQEIHQANKKGRITVRPDESASIVVHGFRIVYAAIFFTGNVIGEIFATPIFAVLSLLSNWFPSFARGSASSKDGLRIRFGKFAVFWKGFLIQSWKSLRILGR